jgi:hypothetical protein
MFSPGDAALEKDHCQKRDKYLDTTKVYGLVHKFLRGLLKGGFLPLNPFPFLVERARQAETRMLMAQPSVSAFLRTPNARLQQERRRFELDQPQPSSPLSQLFVLDRQSGYNRTELFCGWNHVVDKLDPLTMFGLHTTLLACKNPLLLSAMRRTTQVGPFAADVRCLGGGWVRVRSCTAGAVAGAAAVVG